MGIPTRRAILGLAVMWIRLSRNKRAVEYLENNYLAGIRTSPLRPLNYSLCFLAAYGAVAFFVGFQSGHFEPGMVEGRLAFVLPISLFVFPAFLEESSFRGLLIPNGAKERGRKFILSITLLSSTLFTLWHPLNALTINKGAQGIFLDPYFLMIVFCLGVACSLSYIYSKSLWAPVLIHWLTVCVWVLFLGGRNILFK